ncbi:hypothetical protein ACQQ2Q_04820 [Agrobacterium sp. ES01]|uniref:hypothetical protein n=1 Tax=Agrobacterium sp. ES01 TaxID=3420714 RepID=UPI003D11EA12
MGKVVQLGDYRARNQDTAASAAVDIDATTSVAVSFSGTPDQIYESVVEWLSSPNVELRDVVITRPGYIEFSDLSDDDDSWRERYDDSLWEETLPMCDLDDGEHGGIFSADTLLQLIRRHPVGFKAMVTGGLDESVYDENDFIQSFYLY